MTRVALSDVKATAGPQVHDARQASPPQPPDGLSTRQFLALWTLLLLLHTLCGGYLLACARLYWYLEHEYLTYFATLLAPERDRHFRVVGSACGCLGAVHGLQLLGHLGASVVARRPTVRRQKSWSSGVSPILLAIRGLDWALRAFKQQWRPGNRRLRPSANVASQHQGAPRDRELYSRSFAARKIVEVVTQIPHSYLYSTLIARPWINHLKVALVVANCWGSFAVHRLLLSSETSRQVAPSSRSRANDTDRRRPVLRFVIVVVDALLAASAAVLLPSAIFLPYLLQFDVELFTFPPELMYGDTAFPNLVLENRAFFAISWFDAVVKSVPHLGVFLCLRTLSAMLETRSPSLLGSSIQSSPMTSPSRFRRLALSSASSRLLASASHGLWTSAKLIRRLHRVLVPLFFLTAGAAVLLVHLNAQLEVLDRNSDGIRSMCIQQMRPWFAVNLSCAVLNYNCYSQGEVSPPPEALDRLEREALRSVVFSHCSAFEMPASIREFPLLLGIELWNVTLVDWGLSAALSAEKHPVMAFLNFAHVNMTAIPVGILQPPLPERLNDFEFSHTNLTTLPEEVTESWGQVELIYLEHSKLRTFPSVLMQLPVLGELSLIDNHIETLPGELLTTSASIQYYDLAFSRNPLTRLPDEANKDASINFLALEGTQLTTLPAWTATNVEGAVSLGDSPICGGGGDLQLPEIASCTKADELGEERFPIALIEPLRRLELDARSG